MKSHEYLLTPEQVSKILQINVLTVYNYIKKGKLEAILLGRRYRITSEDLDRLLESNRVNKAEKIDRTHREREIDGWD